MQRGDDWAKTNRYTNRQTGTTTRTIRTDEGSAVTRRGAGGGTVGVGEGGNVYAGNDGNVYRRQDGTWQKYDNGGLVQHRSAADRHGRGRRTGHDTPAARAGHHGRSRRRCDRSTIDQLNRDSAARSRRQRSERGDYGNYRSGARHRRHRQLSRRRRRARRAAARGGGGRRRVRGDHAMHTRSSLDRLACVCIGADVWRRRRTRRRRAKRNGPPNRRARRPRRRRTSPAPPSAGCRRVSREFLEQPSGFYPYFASVYSGGGFTLGAGYRQFFGDRTHWDVKGLYSLKNYKFLEVSTDSWGHAKGRLDLHGRVGLARRDAGGLLRPGHRRAPSAESNFRMKQSYVGGDLQARPVRPRRASAPAITYEDYTLEEGTGSSPSIEEIFTPETAPGLGESPTYLHTSLRRPASTGGPSPGYARRGGLYQVTYHNFADQDDTYSFDRVDGEIVQHMPILRETWVVSLHGLVQTTLDDDDEVPYFLLPSLGSGSTLRAYPELALSRSPQPAAVGRVPLDSEPPRPRHGALLRRRQGRAALGRPEPRTA